ncbi:MAG: hypothetical protein JSS97_13515 [Actinobacteria bacterium]|nr:hypothetical protein [Actinomycetota bacterium]
MWRWLAADPWEVVDLAGTGTVAATAEEPHLGEELRRWRGIVARRRLVALLRRHAAVALGLAVVLEIAALLGAFPQWVVVAVPLAAFLASVAFFAFRGPSPFGLARLLDDKLALKDRLATALEIEARGGGKSSLERRTVVDAAGLLQAGREDWRAGAAPAGRTDRVALGAAVVALAVVVGIGLANGGGSAPGPTEALAPPGGSGTAGAPGEHHDKKAQQGNEKQPAPTGKLHKVEGRLRRETSPVKTAEAGYQQIPQGRGAAKKGSAAQANGGSRSPRGGAPKNGTGANPKAGRGKGPNEGKGPSTPSKEREHPTVGFNVKGQKKHKGSGRRGSSEVSGAGAKKSASNGQGDESSSTAQPAKGGTPSGAGKPGSELGNDRQGHATPITGEASQAVKIQPGYAPARAKKGGRERKAPGSEEGAGGKARTARVTGATQVGDQFSFVPAAGGAVPGPSAGLQQNYLESLKWVERLPW